MILKAEGYAFKTCFHRTGVWQLSNYLNQLFMLLGLLQDTRIVGWKLLPELTQSTIRKLEMTIISSSWYSQVLNAA